MSNRRTFVGQCVKGAAGLAVSGLVSSRRVLGANDRVRFGLIGCGSRGKGDIPGRDALLRTPRPSRRPTFTRAGSTR